MQARTSEQRQGPFPGETNDTENYIEDLQDRNGLDGAIEVLGEEIPEDLGPEEAVEPSAYLVYDGKVSNNDSSVEVVMGKCNLQAAAVRMTRRAQWFLINLPIVQKL